MCVCGGGGAEEIAESQMTGDQKYVQLRILFIISAVYKCITCYLCSMVSDFFFLVQKWVSECEEYENLMYYTALLSQNDVTQAKLILQYG